VEEVQDPKATITTKRSIKFFMQFFNYS